MQNLDVVDMRLKRSPESIPVTDVNRVLEAVCNELGIARFETKRRDAVARRIESTWQKGRTQPLYLVDAGLGPDRGSG